jgi:hypothetical protein
MRVSNASSCSANVASASLSLLSSSARGSRGAMAKSSYARNASKAYGLAILPHSPAGIQQKDRPKAVSAHNWAPDLFSELSFRLSSGPKRSPSLNFARVRRAGVVEGLSCYLPMRLVSIGQPHVHHERISVVCAFPVPSLPGTQSKAGGFVPRSIPILAPCQPSGVVFSAGRCLTSSRPQNASAALLESWRHLTVICLAGNREVGGEHSNENFGRTKQ